MSQKAWMVRSGGSGFLIEEFIEQKIVAIGWNELGEIPSNINNRELKELFFKIYPESSDGYIAQSCGQIWRFINEFSIGDTVVTYDPSSRLYYIGEIMSEYIYNDKLSYKHSRLVRWNDNPIERDSLSVDSKNTLGSVLTVFTIPEFVINELRKNATEIDDETILEHLKEVEELDFLKSDVISKSTEFIKDLISKLSWQQTEQLVAGILNGMGYKIRFTSRGSDLGNDIFASPDGLGLVEPRIKVEVKKRTTDKIGAPDIRNFIGGMRGSDKGIYVATTGFTKEARYESERANFPITLVDSDLLVELIIENYEALTPETKALIPLRKIYWPV
ncbi:MAG TPA: restriction endonuclease [Cyclobacteriaceae bacterium]